MRNATLALASTLLLPLTASAADWTLDPTHTRVGFAVKHMIVTDVHGQFGKFDGTVSWNEADVTKSKLDVTIDASSIDTDNGKRDDHLRSPDFFDVAKTPKITFTSKSIQKAGANLKVTGDLTIRGITKSVTLDVSGPTKPIKNPWGGMVSAFSATTKINRKDFGLNWNKALEAGGVLVGDEVTIQISGELNPKQAPSS